MLFAQEKKAPLAELMRPKTLEHFSGQDQVWHPKSLLWSLVHQKTLTSVIIYGPPGCGKTSIAFLIGDHFNTTCHNLSAVSSGIKQIREKIQASVDDPCGPHVVFLDEIHRLNRSQQDVLLPALEDRSILLIGATSQNPSFEVNHAVLSRSHVFRFEKLSSAYLVSLCEKAIHQHWVQDFSVCSQEVLNWLGQAGGGDARKTLNILEGIMSVATQTQKSINLEDLDTLGLDVIIAHDKDGDQHYEIISCLIKSIRASHPDAAVYYLARLLEGGEDINFIARRLVISASEDIGNANPHALTFAESAAQGVHRVGLPEARIILSQTVCLLASSPKSNRSYLAIDLAIDAVKKTGPLSPPKHLLNPSSALSKKAGYGQGYIYPHDHPEESRKITYLPEKLKGIKFYNISNQGHEKLLQEGLKSRRPFAD